MSEDRKPVIVVLGGINMDLVATTRRMPAPGETVHGQAFHTAPGGKGANQAVAAARLGAEVRMVGRVGDDAFGPALLDGLRAEGVDASGVAVDPDNPSGVAMILLDSQAQNCIVAVYGANMACDDAQLDAVRRALVDADALLLQLETPLAVAIEAARLAKERGVMVVWDPAPAVDMGRDAYALCDALTPNQPEAETLTGIAVADSESAALAARELVRRGVSRRRGQAGRGRVLARRRIRGGVHPRVRGGRGRHRSRRRRIRRRACSLARGGALVPRIRAVRVRRRRARGHPRRRSTGDAVQGRAGRSAETRIVRAMTAFANRR